MPRKPLVRSKEFPYHVTVRVNNRERFHLNLDDVWKELAYHLFEVTVLFRVQVFACVLMSNHLHLLLKTPEEDLGVVMQHLLRSFTIKVNRRSNRTGHLFGSRYHWTVIRDPLHYACAFKYVLRNPVKAKITERVEAYRYSSVYGTVGSSQLPFRVFPTPSEFSFFIPKDFDEWLVWLNTPFMKELEPKIANAFRKTEVTFPKYGWKRTPFRFEPAHL